MSNRGYSSLSDNELLDRYGALYNNYASVFEARRKALPAVPKVIAEEVQFTDLVQCLKESVKNHKNLVKRLGLRSSLDSKMIISPENILFKNDVLCRYIRRQAFLLTLFEAVLKGYVNDNTRINTEVYYTVMQYAGNMKLGFSKYRFLFFSAQWMLDRITSEEIIAVMNTINSAIIRLVNKYLAGSMKLDKEERFDHNIPITDKDFLFRLCVYYNSHDEYVSYVNSNINEFVEQ